MLNWSCADAMNIHALNSGLKAAEPPLEKLADNKSLSEEQKVAELSRQFEGVLLRQILGQARKTVFHSKTEDESATSAIYQDMVTAQLAEGISKSGSFGLAKSLQTQLSRQVLNHTDHTQSLSENVGQASSLTVHGASLPRVAGGRMPLEPADKMSAPPFQTGSHDATAKKPALSPILHESK